MKIAFIGSHSTGKTEMVHQTISWFIRNSKDYAVVNEAARLYPGGINENATIFSQGAIFFTHLRDECAAAYNGHQNIICDRGVDNKLYAERVRDRLERRLTEEEAILMEQITRTAEEWQHTYTFQFLLQINPFWGVPKAIAERSDDLEFWRDMNQRALEYSEENKAGNIYVLEPIKEKGPGVYLPQVMEIVRAKFPGKFTER